MVSNPVPDAPRASPGIAWKERRTAPRHAAVSARWWYVAAGPDYRVGQGEAGLVDMRHQRAWISGPWLEHEPVAIPLATANAWLSVAFT